ncbi:MAG: hypothetical protein K8R21_14565, partial [Leptospira sp.]|nr:hypothetical protein [Leptospira sp.]
SLLFLLVGLMRPQLSRPVHTAWMKLAFGMNYIMTRVILFLVFILTVVPMGILLRILRKDILDKKIEKEKQSYWVEREVKVFNVKHYERHF